MKSPSGNLLFVKNDVALVAPIDGIFEVLEESDQSSPIVLVQAEGMTVDVVRKAVVRTVACSTTPQRRSESD